MRRLKAASKREKCKYKRCMYKRIHPVAKPRYCLKHWLVMKDTYKEPVGKTDMKQVRRDYLVKVEEKEKLSLAKKIKLFIFVDK